MAEAEISTIARPYARAAFSRALDTEGGLGTWSRMLAMLSAAVAEEAVEQALENPRLTTEDEAAILCQLLGDELHEEGRNFVNVLATHGRLAALPTISRLFELLKANHEKTMDVNVTSAFDVSEQQKTELAVALQRMLQRNVHIETNTDKTLIGGVVIRAEDTVIDDSVRGRLAKLAHVLG